MKFNLVKKSIVCALVSSLLACGSNDEGFSFNINAESEVTLDSAVLNSQLSEESGIQVIDLLQGVNSEGVALNKDSTSVFLTGFQQLGAESAAITLPQGSILKRGQTLEVDTDAFARLLNWNTDTDEAEKVSYTFEYAIDNGSENVVTRQVNITIDAIYDHVESLTISQPDVYDIPANFPVQIGTTIAPLYATDPSLSFTTADDSVLDVNSSTGVISGKALGTTTLTITPVSTPELAKTITVNVIPDDEVKDPVALEIADGNQTRLPNALDMADCTSYPLSANLLPLASNFDRNVQWTSSDELKGIFNNNESGVLEVAEIFEGSLGTINIAANEPESGQSDSLTVRLKDNYVCNSRFNNNYDHAGTGSLFTVTKQGSKQIWTNISADRAPDVLDIVADKGISGNALHFQSSGVTDAGFQGFEWNPARSPIPVEIGQAGYRFRLAFWVKNNTGVTQSVVTQLNYYIKADGTKWNNPQTPMLNETMLDAGDHWQLVEWEFDSNDWGTDDLRLQVYFKAGNPVDVYLDNFALYELPLL